jgi:hypothetical protein
MNAPAQIGHNHPPDPIDEALAPYGDAISEAEAWLDGAKVENEGQMKAVDALLAEVKAARKAVDAARDTVTKPLHDAWKAEVARWKPTQDDLDRIVKGLVAAVDVFKRKLAEEREAARRAAERAAWEAAEAARIAAQAADPANLEDQRAAARKQAEAEAAQAAAAEAAKAGVKGLRTYTIRTVDDPLIFARWVWLNDRPAYEAWLQTYLDKMPMTPPAGCGATERKERRAV